MMLKPMTHAPGKPGRKPALRAENIKALKAIVARQPEASLDEVMRALQRRAGVKVCSAPMRKVLRAAGVTRLKPQRAPSQRAATQGEASRRQDYTPTLIGARPAPAA